MRTNLLAPLFCLLLLAPAGCKKSTTTRVSSSAKETVSPALPENHQLREAYFDVCGLIKKEEIEGLQGATLQGTKSGGRSDGTYRVSWCFYSTAEPNKSVSLSVKQRDPATNRGGDDFWEKTFNRYAGAAKEDESDKEKEDSGRKHRRGEEEEGSVPPKKIDGIGDEALWFDNRMGGALYVLKKEKAALIRIGIGGADTQETKIDKSKKLAQKALDRL